MAARMMKKIQKRWTKMKISSLTQKLKRKRESRESFLRRKTRSQMTIVMSPNMLAIVTPGKRTIPAVLVRMPTLSSRKRSRRLPTRKLRKKRKKPKKKKKRKARSPTTTEMNLNMSVTVILGKRTILAASMMKARLRARSLMTIEMNLST